MDNYDQFSEQCKNELTFGGFYMFFSSPIWLTTIAVILFFFKI